MEFNQMALNQFLLAGSVAGIVAFAMMIIHFIWHDLIGK